jgi:hypothetical protein
MIFKTIYKKSRETVPLTMNIKQGLSIFMPLRNKEIFGGLSPQLRTPNAGFNPGFTPFLYKKCGV